MNMNDLLADSQTIDFTLTGGKGKVKKGKVKMQSPSNAKATEIRNEFFAYGKRLAAAEAAHAEGKDYDGEPIPIGLEICMANAVMACISPDDPLSEGLDVDSARTFVKRIGGMESDVVKYAVSVMGIAAFDADDTEGDHSDFS